MTRNVSQFQSLDVMVLGAGISGVSTALHLRRLGFDTALIDRGHPGEQASFGSAGLIKNSGFLPPVFQNRAQQLLKVLVAEPGAVPASLRLLSDLSPWLRQHRIACRGAGAELYTRVIAPFRALAASEHLDLAASTNADRFYRRGGWLDLHRHARSALESDFERYNAEVFGVPFSEVSGEDLHLLEPGLEASHIKAVHWRESCFVSDPGAVVDALWRAFVHEGGHFSRGDARKLQKKRGGWVLESERSTFVASDVVVALGAWSMDILKLLGERFPLAFLRGYHTHYRPVSGASLSRPVVDADNGLTLTPTDTGIRLTTGLSFAEREAAPDPEVVKRAKKRASEIFPLGRELQSEPWMGHLACVPDCLPLVGPSAHTKGLWLNFGHLLDGFALGPIAGRLLAETIAGKRPALDISGLSPDRFR